MVERWTRDASPEYEQFLNWPAAPTKHSKGKKAVSSGHPSSQDGRSVPPRLVNDHRLYSVRVKKSTPGFLAFDPQTIREKFAGGARAKERMIEDNYRSDVFLSAAAIDREIRERLEAVVHPVIEVRSDKTSSTASRENSAFDV